MRLKNPYLSKMNWTRCWEKRHTHTAAGCGLFARQNIRRGQLILWVCPEAELAIVDNLIELYTFVVNHSCIPNMFHVEVKNQRTGLDEIRFYAMRDIQLGEELTRFYADPPFSSSVLRDMAGSGKPGLVVDAQDFYNVLARESDVRRRRALIWAIWGFYCLCTKCVGQWSHAHRWGTSVQHWPSHCPAAWCVDYPLSTGDPPAYREVLVGPRESEEFLKRDKIRIMAQRTIFNLKRMRSRIRSQTVHEGLR